VKDAIGEICNMLAGTWKSKVRPFGKWAVISGSDYNLHVQSPEFKIHQAFCFDDTRFELTIVCDGMQSL
jgi:chemotaxis protein CheX